MEQLDLILTGTAAALMALHFFKVRQLDKLIEHQQAHIGDLTHSHNEAVEFLEYQMAKLQYQKLASANQLRFHADTLLSEAVQHSNVRDVLVKSKLIKKKEEPGDESIANRADNLKISLEPILVKLNMLEISS